MKNSIVSPMPGRILEINVKAGDEVTKGQQVFVIESMKMEMPIVADVDGIVEKINIEVGTNVKGQESFVILI